jgi:hypothetical protein
MVNARCINKEILIIRVGMASFENCLSEEETQE